MKNNEGQEMEFNMPFHSKAYWEDYYINYNNLNQLDDWYFDIHFYQSNMFNINKWDKHSEIIILGTGNSKIVDYLLSKKFPHVSLIDFSPYLIDWLKNRYENREDCQEWDCKF
jgi:hypothetical protein